jgi:hypothetical protein
MPPTSSLTPFQTDLNDSTKDSHTAIEPSGPRGDNPSTAGPGPTAIKSKTPENALGHLNPSSPEDANTTPGSASSK